MKLDAHVYVWRSPDEQLRLFHRELSEALNPNEALRSGWAEEVVEF